MTRVAVLVSFQLSADQIPETEPWCDEEFLWHAYHEEGMTPRAIAYDLGVETSRVTVHMERLGILRPWRHEDTLRRLYIEQGLSADEIAARDEFNCTPTTVRKYLAKYGLTDDDSDEVTYGRLDDLGSEPPTSTL